MTHMRDNNAKDSFEFIRQKYLGNRKKEEDMLFFEWIVRRVSSDLVLSPLFLAFLAIFFAFLGLVLASACIAVGVIMPLWFLVSIYKKVFNNDNDNNKSSTVNPSIRLARRDSDA